MKFKSLFKCAILKHTNPIDANLAEMTIGSSVNLLYKRYVLRINFTFIMRKVK